jgi:hypothetical protein
MKQPSNNLSPGENIRIAFIDESGNVAISKSGHLLLIAAVCTDDSISLVRLVRKSQKKYGSSLRSGELKGKNERPEMKREFLQALADKGVEIYSIVIDRKILENPPKDPEDIYRWAMARLVKKIVNKYPRMDIVLDKRYTTEQLRIQLEKSIREAIVGIQCQFVMIYQEDSARRKELQAVDIIA